MLGILLQFTSNLIQQNLYNLHKWRHAIQKKEIEKSIQIVKKKKKKKKKMIKRKWQNTEVVVLARAKRNMTVKEDSSILLCQLLFSSNPFYFFICVISWCCQFNNPAKSHQIISSFTVSSVQSVKSHQILFSQFWFTWQDEHLFCKFF